VQIEILFCGMCHSGLHQVRNNPRKCNPDFLDPFQTRRRDRGAV